eukprot:6489049-Amphidinium_carterae.3
MAVDLPSFQYMHICGRLTLPTNLPSSQQPTTRLVHALQGAFPMDSASTIMPCGSHHPQDRVSLINDFTKQQDCANHGGCASLRERPALPF